MPTRRDSSELILRSSASVNGRPINLDPIVDRDPLPLPVRRVENSLPCGLRTHWIDGEAYGDEPGPLRSFTLTAGAGVGSPWLVLTIHLRDGSTITEVVDMRATVTAWLDAALAAGPSPEVTE